MRGTNRRARGLGLEEEAARYLAKRGARILERNFEGRRGEIDIVAEEGDALLIVEVRSKREGSPIGPAESVTIPKARKLYKTALEYLARRGIDDRAVRFDVVAIRTDDAGAIRSIEWLKDFFDLTDL